MVAESSPLHQFVITPLIPIHLGGFDLSFTNASLWMVIGTVLTMVLFTVGGRRQAMVPGRLQLITEMMYEFIAGMVRENGGHGGMRYFSIIFTIFMFILMGNTLGLLPYSFTYTAQLIIPAALALVVFLLVILMGVINHGLRFFTLFLPPGVPLWLWPLVIPLEVISFSIRPMTLSVRLFANMIAGHLMLKVFAGFSIAMLSFGALGWVAAMFPMLFNVILTAFECLIALIHAYVFTILSCLYLKDSLDIGH